MKENIPMHIKDFQSLSNGSEDLGGKDVLCKQQSLIL